MSNIKKENYVCDPTEFISSRESSELYDLEERLFNIIKAIVQFRKEEFNENEWKKSLPQTLHMILDHYDRNASLVAAKAFISKEKEEIEVKENI